MGELLLLLLLLLLLCVCCLSCVYLCECVCEGKMSAMAASTERAECREDTTVLSIGFTLFLGLLPAFFYLVPYAGLLPTPPSSLRAAQCECSCMFRHLFCFQPAT